MDVQGVDDCHAAHVIRRVPLSLGMRGLRLPLPVDVQDDRNQLPQARLHLHHPEPVPGRRRDRRQLQPDDVPIACGHAVPRVRGGPLPRHLRGLVPRPRRRDHDQGHRSDLPLLQRVRRALLRVRHQLHRDGVLHHLRVACRALGRPDGRVHLHEELQAHDAHVRSLLLHGGREPQLPAVQEAAEAAQGTLRVARPRVARHRHRAHRQHHPGRAHAAPMVPDGLPLVLRGDNLRPSRLRDAVSPRQRGPGRPVRDEADHHRGREQRGRVLGRGAADVGHIHVAGVSARSRDSRVHAPGLEAAGVQDRHQVARRARERHPDAHDGRSTRK
mmetsp:Transcript_8483/g.37446  ORF Transcript_8483/g.37446 Transcript_8483/m.37446 type:complete len:329 (+) Transcript_8483:46-1032(+)